MRVGLVVTYDLVEEGGVKRHAMNLGAELARRGDEVTVIGPASRDVDGRTSDGVTVVGLPGVVNIPANGSDNRIGVFTPPWRVRSLVKGARFDVLHVHEPLVPSLAYWALWSTPGSAHVATFHGFAESEPTAARLGRSAWGRLVLRRYERGIAVSEPAERFARPSWPWPLARIPNGVPTRVYRRELPSTEQSVAATRERPLRALFVGHWRDARKGLAHLLDAMRQLRTEGAPVELDVIGKGPDGQPPPLVDGVRFHGGISDERELARRYHAADVFVSPATGQESFGIVLLEAMASGLPVVCSDIAGYRQVITDEGARFVPPGDEPALARALVALAEDGPARRRMADANQRRAASFDWPDITTRVRAVYDEALAARRA